MRKIYIAVLVAAAVVSLFVWGNRAEAMTLAAPSQLGLAASDTTLVQKARWHRGWHAHDWGRRYYWGWPIPWFHIRLPHWRGWGWHHHYHHWHHW
jgi:hypothetical protein